MKKITVTTGGWMWYIQQIKENNPSVVIDYAELMRKYIAGVKWEDAV